VPAAKPAPAPQPPASAPPPVFGQILTPQQQIEMKRGYDANTNAARRILDQLSSRRLNGDQTAAANRIRSILDQAAGALPRDLPTAAQLARRAEVLSNELAASVR
jgi:hypothetical protein